MKRVTWPSRREVYATTLVVILTSVFFGLYLFGVDLMFSCGDAVGVAAVRGGWRHDRRR